MPEPLELGHLYIVTLKLNRYPDYNSRAKITAPCPVSAYECTDASGAHHSVLWYAASPKEIRKYYAERGTHVTRIERANQPLQLVTINWKGTESQ